MVGRSQDCYPSRRRLQRTERASRGWSLLRDKVPEKEVRGFEAANDSKASKKELLG